MLDGSPYQGYLYAYPHKTAYRPLRPRPALADVWAGERRDALFLYLHIPFCEMRCGFCNLFTRARPPAEQVSVYLRQLRAQAERVREALGPGTSFARAAIGGGTPTYLTAAELAELFDIVHGAMAVPAGVPLGVETSPATATPDRLAVLVEHGVTRISIGVQSFLHEETRAAVRPQHPEEVARALDAIRDSGAPVLNIDLIYGIDGQTARTWQFSLDSALRWRPEELYLYPLYVRPLTGLHRRAVTRADWDRERMALYEQAVEHLTAAGYRQESMRQFRRADVPAPEGPVAAKVRAEERSDEGGPRRPSGAPSERSQRDQRSPDYCCQDDGMVGLGCGARSYTTGLHYSFDYAVATSEVRAVIEDYLGRPATDFDRAEVGFHLDGVEQRRRWLIKSLLRADGMDPAAYQARFGSTHLADFPQLVELVERGWSTGDGTRLTPAGLARSDLVGPWLVSGAVRDAMNGYAPR